MRKLENTQMLSEQEQDELNRLKKIIKEREQEIEELKAQLRKLKD